ncbi:hypothetical protein MMC28_004384 [Mycoblastus sanguinarius]|nr:hypothetical protein [Mycoblastus sanguinarius]
MATTVESPKARKLWPSLRTMVQSKPKQRKECVHQNCLGKKMSNAPKSFPVLKLPAELRIRIWTLTVVSDKPIIVKEHHRGFIPPSLLRSGTQLHLQDDQRRMFSRLAVAFTCRQIYLEVAPIYYSMNIFSIITSNARILNSFVLQNFRRAIGPRNTEAITALRLNLEHCPPSAYLGGFPGLKTVHMEHLYMWRSEFRQLSLFCQLNPSLVLKHDGETVDRRYMADENGK